MPYHILEMKEMTIADKSITSHQVIKFLKHETLKKKRFSKNRMRDELVVEKVNDELNLNHESTQRNNPE